MRAGDRVMVREIEPDDTKFKGCHGRIIATQTLRSEVGYLVQLDGEPRPLYFGPGGLIPVSAESSPMIAGE